jgi:large subunit ribosomal protein L32
MPPLPKRKYAKARQGDRRRHLRITPPTLVDCPQCHNPRPAHQVCPTCGTYQGRQVLDLDETKKS